MSHARVPTIDPDGQREGDAGAIPLSSLRPPHAPPLRQASDESFGGPPPAHYAHPHGFDNPNYFEGYDVGNQPREEDLNAPSASASGSGSSASRQNEKQGWGKFDTYVGGREQALKFDGESIELRWARCVSSVRCSVEGCRYAALDPRACCGLSSANWFPSRRLKRLGRGGAATFPNLDESGLCSA